MGDFVDVVLFLRVLDLIRSADFLMETEFGLVGFEVYKVEVRLLSLVLKRVVFVLVELVVPLNWFFFSMVAFVVELVDILMDLIGLDWSSFLLLSSSFSVASILLPKEPFFWGWAAKTVRTKREVQRKKTNQKERDLLSLKCLKEEEEAI